MPKVALGTLPFGEAMLRGMGMERGNAAAIARTASMQAFFRGFREPPPERPGAPRLRWWVRCL